MAKKNETIDVSRRNFLMGFRKLREEEPGEAQTPVASTDETFDLLKEANLAYKDRNWEPAREKYEAFLKKESRNPNARFRLGRCLYETGKYIQAKIQFEQVLRLRREDQDATLFLGLSLMRLDRPEKAAVIWRMYMNPKAMPIQREVNIQLAFIEDTSMETPLPADMAAAVEGAVEEYRLQKLKG
ncbi:MAG: tetratricopeptide repeat protein [Proteobacteria bacterium]|nr:tetratricopeptide repeat protein [Pseudomonadota bacterium]MBU1610501.1 tetratricopeptide repeat protein [Pseudomonadota bacterium]